MVSEQYDIPAGLLRSVVHVESSFYQDAESYAGAVGLLQVTKPALKDYNNTATSFVRWSSVVSNWRVNLYVGAWYLKYFCYKNTLCWTNAITAYFWGLNNTNASGVYSIKVFKEYKKIKGLL